MFFDIQVLAKLFKIEDPEESARTYSDYLTGINTIIIQYLEDETILAQLPHEKLDEIQDSIEKIEKPEEIIDYLYKQLPETHREEFKQELKKALDSFQNKILYKGLADMNSQEIQSFLSYLDEYKKDFQDIAKQIEESDVLNSQNAEAPALQTESQEPTLENIAQPQSVPEPVKLQPEQIVKQDTQPVVETEESNELPPLPATEPQVEPIQATPASLESVPEQDQTKQSQPVYPPLEQFTQAPQVADTTEKTEDSNQSTEDKPTNPPVNFSLT